MDDKVEEENIIGKCKDALRFRSEYSCAFIAIGDVNKRKRFAKLLQECNFLIPNIISPVARISSQAKIGKGVAILPQATINDAEIGDFCILASNSLVSSNSTAGDFCKVGCGAMVLKETKVPSLIWIDDGEIYKKVQK